ncbi:MAG: phasin family protein [Pseudomonadota bacterium]
MNMIERQSELGKSLFEINTNTLKELANLQKENVEKYFETNRSFGERLPEVKSVSDFLALQREYGETLWNNTREAVETQTEIVRGAFAETTDALKTAFNIGQEEAAAAAPKKATAKAKPKAKKPAASAS